MSEDLLHLVKAEHELNMLKAFLVAKLTGYCGITHSELQTICIMLGVILVKEEKPDE